MLTPCSPLLLNSELVMKRQEKEYRASICLCYLSHGDIYDYLASCLHPLELNYYNNLKFEKRKKEYLLGRYSAKMALSVLSRENQLDSILIEQGVFKQPIVSGSAMLQNLEVTITHCDGLAAAVAFPQAYPLGIDIERVSPDKIKVIEREMTEEEKKILKVLPMSEAASLTSFWTAKEALSKVLKTGLTTPFYIFEIAQVEEDKGYLVSHYKRFSQYCCLSFNWREYIFSLTCPKGTLISGECINLIKGIYF